MPASLIFGTVLPSVNEQRHPLYFVIGAHGIVKEICNILFGKNRASKIEYIIDFFTQGIVKWKELNPTPTLLHRKKVLNNF